MKQQRNALLFTALSFLYATLQLFRPYSTITWFNKSLSLLLPLIAILFALNTTHPRIRWAAIGLNFALILLMIFVIWRV